MKICQNLNFQIYIETKYKWETIDQITKFTSILFPLFENMKTSLYLPKLTDILEYIIEKPFEGSFPKSMW